MFRSVTTTFYPLVEKQSTLIQNKQNINNESPVKGSKSGQSLNRKFGASYLPSNQSLDKETIKLVFGQNQNQKQILNDNNSFGGTNLQGITNNPQKRASPLKQSKQFLISQNYLQNLKPMKDVNTSFDDELNENGGQQCQECRAFH